MKSREELNKEIIWKTSGPVNGIYVINAPTMYYAAALQKFGPMVRFVDRGTDWGNPFIMDHENEREKVCYHFELYALWRLTIEPNWLAPLRDHHLVCHCAPKRCHAETLRRLANA